jgi:hypothetical protein
VSCYTAAPSNRAISTSPVRDVLHVDHIDRSLSGAASSSWLVGGMLSAMVLRRVALLLALLSPACAGGEDSDTTVGSVASFAEDGTSDVASTTSIATDTSGLPGDTGPDADSSGATTDPTAGDPPDLGQGMWVFENVSETPVMGFHPRRAWATDGREIVAWAEGELDDNSTLNIIAATRDGDTWDAVPLTDYTGVQNTFPSMVSEPVPMLAWTGRAMVGDDDDVFVATAGPDGWSAARNVSNALEPAIEARADLRPSLAANNDGGLAIAYISSEISNMGLDATPEVFVSEFTVDEDPTKRVAVVDATTTSCSDLTGAAAPSGVFHFVLLCVQGGQSTLIQATNRSGEWTADELSGLGTAILSPSAAPARDGVHVVWVQRQPCGNDECYEVFHSSTKDEVFASPVAVTDQVNLDERRPAVGVDPWGRILVVHQAAVDGATGVYLSLSEDGGEFISFGRISPGGTQDDYQTPTAITFDQDGNPSFALEVLEAGSDPLNVDIWVARFVPA